VGVNDKGNEKQRNEIIDNIGKLELRIKNLEDKYTDDEIDIQTYRSMRTRYKIEIDDLHQKKGDTRVEKQELTNMLDKDLELLQNIDILHNKSHIEDKQRLISSIF